MSKIATDIFQSKKLAEILPIESADMMWTYDFTINDINGLNIISDNLKPEDNDIPAWSLSALIDCLLAKGETSPTFTLTRGGWDSGANYSGNWFTYIEDEEDINIFVSRNAEDAIDAVYELILILKDKGFFLNSNNNV